MNSRKIKKQNRKKEKYRRSVKLGGADATLQQMTFGNLSKALKWGPRQLFGEDGPWRRRGVRSAAEAEAEAQETAKAVEAAEAAKALVKKSNSLNVGMAVFYTRNRTGDPVKVIITGKDNEDNYNIKPYPGPDLADITFDDLSVKADVLFLKKPQYNLYLGYVEDIDGELAETINEGQARRANTARAEAAKADAGAKASAETADADAKASAEKADADAKAAVEKAEADKRAEYEPSFEALGIQYGATQAEISKAYRKKSLTAHPDKGGDTNQFNKLTLAYEKLQSMDGGSATSHKYKKSHKKRRTQKRHKKSKKHRRLRKTRR